MGAIGNPGFTEPERVEKGYILTYEGDKGNHYVGYVYVKIIDFVKGKEDLCVVRRIKKFPYNECVGEEFVVPTSSLRLSPDQYYEKGGVMGLNEDGTPASLLHAHKIEGSDGFRLVDKTILKSEEESHLHCVIGTASASSCMKAATKTLRNLWGIMSREKVCKRPLMVLKSAEIRCVRPVPLDEPVWIVGQLVPTEPKGLRYRGIARIYNKKASFTDLLSKTARPRHLLIIRALLVATNYPKKVSK